MNVSDKICVVGSNGMLGHAITSQLESLGYTDVLKCCRKDVDLCNQAETRLYFETHKPKFIFFCAAVAAGINYKKSHPADMMLQNLQMITNVMDSTYRCGCKKMINVCSALLYPSSAEIPIKEEAAAYCNLGEIDTPYAMAKAAGMQLARYYNAQYGTDYLTVVPCNFFGEYAPFEGERAGVVPSLIAKMHNAKVNHLPEVVVWGTGNVCREFLNSKDVASACIHLMNCETEYDLINIGRGNEYSIRETAECIKHVVGYSGELVFDTSKPEGRPHMQLNVKRLSSTGWVPSMDLEQSISDTYRWYCNSID